jgi:hypothetical protein
MIKENGSASYAAINFFFPVKALSKVFRAKYVQQLREKGIADKTLIEHLFAKPWVVYAKRPFGGPQQVIEYLGRYTHKVAISNHRIIQVDKTAVSFSYKDYRDGGNTKQMTLSNAEFVRRFAQHILPLRFVRIRHYGILSRHLETGQAAGFTSIVAGKTKRTACEHSTEKVPLLQDRLTHYH